MTDVETQQVEFSRWLDQCIRDAQGKLGLGAMDIALVLLQKLTQALLRFRLNGDK